MFDTMTVTKVVAALCGALLIFLLGGWLASSMYSVGPAGHGEGEVAQAYSVEVASAEVAETTEEAGPAFEEVFATADAAAGEALFKNCRSCHSLDAGKNMTGPSLHGVVGRTVDSAADFKYSGALVAAFDVWTPEHLNTFLTNPKEAAPGTLMSFKGMSKIEDRANMIAYLATLTN